MPAGCEPAANEPASNAGGEAPTTRALAVSAPAVSPAAAGCGAPATCGMLRAEVCERRLQIPALLHTPSRMPAAAAPLTPAAHAHSHVSAAERREDGSHETPSSTRAASGRRCDRADRRRRPPAQPAGDGFTVRAGKKRLAEFKEGGELKLGTTTGAAAPRLQDREHDASAGSLGTRAEDAGAQKQPL